MISIIGGLSKLLRIEVGGRLPQTITDTVANMNQVECRTRFGSARVATLATVGTAGPHLVPVVFALDADQLFTVVDHKPKRTVRLRRLANIVNNPFVALLVDHYNEDWEQLWWVRADGVARVIEDNDAMRPGVDLLVNRYDHYRTARPDGPLIEVSIKKWTGWSARPDLSESFDGLGQ